MKFAVCIYKFFPFGGLARDFLRIMQASLTADDTVDVFVMALEGELPANFNVHHVAVKGWSNHAKLQSFIDNVQPRLSAGGYDLIIGFNKMPGLDVYYAADPCYLDRVQNHPLYGILKLSGRVRFYSACEQAVFGMQSDTVSLMISDVQQALFKQHYGTPDERMIALPPGIDRDRRKPENAQDIRDGLRQELRVNADDWLILMVGTGFKTKGVDRAIAALAELPESLKNKVQLFVVGDGDASTLEKQASQLSVQQQVHFLGGRTDVPQFLLAADLLIHPARKENTGTVLLEAIVAGLPVLVSDVCGYAKHVLSAQAGRLLINAADAKQTASDISDMLDKERLQQWSANALAYADSEDLYSMPEKAAQIIREMAALKHKEEIA